MRGRATLAWGATVIAFPLAGLLARAVAGPIDDTSSGLVGGLAVGGVIGTAQALAARSRISRPWMWIAASAAATGVGLAAGSALVDFSTTLPALAMQGAVTGAALGLAQLPFLRPTIGRRALWWPVATAALWAAGWSAVFGLSGAAVVTVGSGLALLTAADPSFARQP
jgi:hypothetical protein